MLFFFQLPAQTGPYFIFTFYVGTFMVHKSKMTIHSPMLSIPKRHWPGLSRMREIEVKAAGPPVFGSFVGNLLPSWVLCWSLEAS